MLVVTATEASVVRKLYERKWRLTLQLHLYRTRSVSQTPLLSPIILLRKLCNCVHTYMHILLWIPFSF